MDAHPVWWTMIITLPNGKKSSWSKVATEHGIYEVRESQHRVVAKCLPELHEAIHKASSDTCVYTKRFTEKSGKQAGHQNGQRHHGGVATAVPATVSSPSAPDSQAISAVTKQLGEQLAALSPRQFEVFVGKYIEKRGLRELQVTGRSHDGGIDGTATEGFLGVKVAFQAKRWAHTQTVGAAPIRELLGSITNREADRGVFITTSSFSPGAKEEAELSHGKIILVDGQRLAQDCIDLQLGIKPRVVQADIDEGFFSSL